MTDILDLIDEVTAPVCGWCQTPLRVDGASSYFCAERCQFEWQRLQGDVPKEPALADWFVADGRPPARPPAAPMVRHQFTIPRGLQVRDFVEVDLLRATSIMARDNGDGTVSLVNAELRRPAPAAAPAPSPPPAPARLEGLAQTLEAIGRAFERWGESGQIEQLAAMVRQLQDAGVVQQPLPADPRERALELRRNRNTGPAQRRRAPRTIRPRGCQ